MPIYKPSELKELGIRPKGALSQNFLIDQNILKKIIQTADVKSGDLILEIGPGPGALTEKLLNAGAHVIAIEKDEHLAHLLERFQTKDQRLQVITGNALQVSLASLLPKRAKVVANLPYHITTPLLQKLTPCHKWISSLTLMVQKEFGKRMTAEKSSSLYSSFSIFLQAHSKIRYAFTIKSTCFYPKPKVDSCMVHLQLHSHNYEEGFFTFVRTAFRQRRKMLRSSLKEKYPNIEEALEKGGFQTTTRPQELSVRDFETIFRLLTPRLHFH